MKFWAAAAGGALLRCVWAGQDHKSPPPSETRRERIVFGSPIVGRYD